MCLTCFCLRCTEASRSSPPHLVAEFGSPCRCGSGAQSCSFASGVFQSNPAAVTAALAFSRSASKSGMIGKRSGPVDLYSTPLKAPSDTFSDTLESTWNTWNTVYHSRPSEFQAQLHAYGQWQAGGLQARRQVSESKDAPRMSHCTPLAPRLASLV